MKKILIAAALLLGISQVSQAQELYVNAEPASNMPANSLGIRLSNKFFQMEHSGVTGMRFEPEVMWGINKKLMVHVIGYASNMMQPSIRAEGGSVYAKYRFLSLDQQHAHFRMAAYVKGSVIDNPYYPDMSHGMKELYNNRELDLEGATSGASGGIVATQLLHKLALSTTLGYTRYMNNLKDNIPAEFSKNEVNYSFSAGYLLLPVKYRHYGQTNLNLYMEFLGKTNTDAIARGAYLDIAPAIQLIFNSTTRLDLSYRTQLAGNMPRNMYNSFLVRIEHNIFNINKK
ncbi:hypothetical protein [Chitinophaga nivalis]|uniref:Transporter n=1 Tax=Chitinophaga nivalis TaxID=2991709 RepID=A0ABT3ISP8_9BACT|nr:hypothetical protein [Chitinophaga nivalis]MCW3463581.1 hypothetical protein [Chitinophaga nivalis]MCW3486729.1 hypothetical protein [Chitinophaga nivalis]